MSQELYYTAPSDEIFEDIKANALKIWRTYDNTYGYQDEKVGRIRDLKNVKDNYMYMVAMFDSENQAKLFTMVRPETQDRIEKALV